MYEGKGAKKLNWNFQLGWVCYKMNKTNYPDWFLEKINGLSQEKLVEMLWNFAEAYAKDEWIEEMDKKQEQLRAERLAECENGRKRQQEQMLKEFWTENQERDWKKEGDEWFDRKYPDACCHRCEEKLSSDTVVMCGGGGGDCETWYCAACHEEGTDDCDVCAAMNNVQIDGDGFVVCKSCGVGGGKCSGECEYESCEVCKKKDDTVSFVDYDPTHNGYQWNLCDACK